jgi:hypothetical protein
MKKINLFFAVMIMFALVPLTMAVSNVPYFYDDFTASDINLTYMDETARSGGINSSWDSVTNRQITQISLNGANSVLYTLNDSYNYMRLTNFQIDSTGNNYLGIGFGHGGSMEIRGSAGWFVGLASGFYFDFDERSPNSDICARFIDISGSGGNGDSPEACTGDGNYSFNTPTNITLAIIDGYVSLVLNDTSDNSLIFNISNSTYTSGQFYIGTGMHTSAILGPTKWELDKAEFSNGIPLSALPNVTFTNSVHYPLSPQTNDTIQFNITMTSADGTNIDFYTFSYWNVTALLWENITVAVGTPTTVASHMSYLPDFDWFNWTWYANITGNATVYQSGIFAVHLNDIFAPTINAIASNYTPLPNQRVDLAGYAENNIAVDWCWVYNNFTNTITSNVKLHGRVDSCYTNITINAPNGTHVLVTMFVNDSMGLIGNDTLWLNYTVLAAVPPTNYGWTPTGNFIYDFVFGYGSAFAGQALASLAVTIGVLLLIGIELFKYAKKK